MTWDRARHLFEAGESFRAIAAECGISRSALYRRARRDGWERRPEAETTEEERRTMAHLRLLGAVQATAARIIVGRGDDIEPLDLRRLADAIRISITSERVIRGMAAEPHPGSTTHDRLGPSEDDRDALDEELLGAPGIDEDPEGPR